MGQGNGHGLTPRVVGQIAGQETHALVVGETPSHSHTVRALSNPTTTNNIDTPGPSVVLAQTVGKDSKGNPITVNIYAPDNAPSQPMSTAAIGATGGQPHPNLMPYLTVNMCIALQGIFPSRN